MRFPAPWLFRIVGLLIAIVGLPLLGFEGVPRLKKWWDLEHQAVESVAIVAEKANPHVILVGTDSRTLRLPLEVLETLQIQTALVQPAQSSDTLKLEGSLFLDANRLVHVNSRFSGDVIELGMVEVADNDLIFIFQWATNSLGSVEGENVAGFRQ